MSRVLLVLDCNVYLDVARLIGSPFSAARFHDLATEHSRALVSHPSDPAVDSLRLIAACQSGQMDPAHPLEVWTSEHIRTTVAFKAEQSTRPDPRTGHRGLGWDHDAAWDLVDGVADWIAECSGGGHLATFVGAVDVPPLDHEDGTVYAACRHLEGQNPLDQVFCVTRDKGFLRAHAEGRLSGTVQVVTPAAMLQALRSARRRIMPPPAKRPR